MNILHITVRSDIGGGPEHLYQQTLSQVNDHGLNIYIACPNEEPYYELYSNIISKQNINIIPHRKFSFYTFVQLLGFIKKNNINLIHSHGKGAGIYSRALSIFSRIECVHTFHGLHIGEYSALQKKAYIYLESLLGFCTSKIICVSKSELEEIKKENIACSKKLIQIDNGVSISELNLTKKENKPLKVIAVNRFDHQKNPELLISISTKIKNSFLYGKVHITVIGTGKRLNEFRQIIEHKKLNNVLTLHGPTLDPRKFMSESDIFLSTSRWEGMPLAVLEAMSEGLPIVATKVSGNDDVMQNGVEGLFFKNNDASSAILAIEKMMNQEFRLSCSKAAHKNILKNFSVTKMVNETVYLYKTILLK